MNERWPVYAGFREPSLSINKANSDGKYSLKTHPLVRSTLKKINQLRCKTWDLLHGVETCGEIPVTAFDFESEHKSPGLEYQSHHPKILRQILSALDLEHERYTFVDYGCG